LQYSSFAALLLAVAALWPSPAFARQSPAAQVTPPGRAGGTPPQTKPAPPRRPRTPAPPDPRRWDIEFHKGFGTSRAEGNGAGSLPSPGASFTTLGGLSSRRVASWYFGDGSALLNEALASLNRPERIAALDDVLRRRATESPIESGFGIRVTRVMTSRFTVEFAVEVAPITYTVLETAKTGLATTSSSFMTAFAGIVASGGGVAATNPTFSSSQTTADGTGSEILATGSLVFGRRAGRMRPYVALGGGLARATGGATANLTGRYTFRTPGGAQVDETDAVHLTFGGGNGAVVLAAGGLSFFLTGASGVRLDGRVHFVQNHIDTRVSTDPLVAQSLPADVLATSLTPGIQFATHPSTNHQSNLIDSLSDVRVFNGTGFAPRSSFSIGYFIRF
jgi:hypothetical protein